MRAEVNIAWHGDLKQMPRRFEIYDMSGRRIAGGAVSEGDGTANWHSIDQAPGVYLLEIFHAQGALLTTSRFIKE